MACVLSIVFCGVAASLQQAKDMLGGYMVDSCTASSLCSLEHRECCSHSNEDDARGGFADFVHGHT